MPFNDQTNPLNYPANNRDPFRRFRADRAPTPDDFRNFKIGDFWIDEATNELYFLVDKKGTAIWILLSSGPGPGVESLTGNSGGPVSGDGAENINIVGTGNVNVVGTPGNNTLTISSTAGATETLTGNTGGAVGPDGADNINFVGMAPFTVAGNPGTNTLTIENDGTLAEDYQTDSGTAQPFADTLLVLGGTNISTTGAGNTITINGTAGAAETLTGNSGGAVGPDGADNIDFVGMAPFTVVGNPGANTLTIENDGTLAENYQTDSGTAQPFADTLDVLGGTGISTTGAGNVVTINADADIANQYTTDNGIAIPVANNLNVLGDGTLITSGTGSTITITTSPTVDSYNIGFTFAGGTFTMTAEDGSALSATNKGFVRVAKKSTPGTFLYIPIIANQTFIDSTGASTIIGNLFGLTTSIAHTNVIPFYVYGVVNTAETEIAFMISRYPTTPVSPVAAKIGQSGSAIASTQGSFFSLKSITATDFEQNPASRLGSFRMSMNASDDWAVSALALNDGMGKYQENTRFTMTKGQFGAKAANYFIDNGGTAPAIFGTSTLAYEIIDDIAHIDLFASFSAGGVGAVVLTYKVPFKTSLGGGTGAGTFYITDGVLWVGTTSVPLFSNSVNVVGTNSSSVRFLRNTDALTNATIVSRASLPIIFS